MNERFEIKLLTGNALFVSDTGYNPQFEAIHDGDSEQVRDVKKRLAETRRTLSMMLDFIIAVDRYRFEVKISDTVSKESRQAEIDEKINAINDSIMELKDEASAAEETC